MKNIVLKCGKVLAGLALMVTISNLNSTCFFIAYQPKIPEKLNRLRKYKL